MLSSTKAHGKRNSVSFFSPPRHISFHRMAQHCNSHNTEMQPLIFLLSFVSVSVIVTPGGEQKGCSTRTAKRWHRGVLTSQGDRNSMWKRKGDSIGPDDVPRGSVSAAQGDYGWGARHSIPVLDQEHNLLVLGSLDHKNWDFERPQHAPGQLTKNKHSHCSS